MLGGGLPIETTTRARSAAALAAAVLVAAFGVFDAAREAPALALAARGLWIAALLVVSRLVLRDGGRRIVFPAMLAAGASILALSILTYLDGGEAGGSAMFLLAAPLFIAVLVPDELPVAISAAAASTAATALVFAVLGRDTGHVAVAAARAAIAGGFAIFGTALQARVRRSEAGVAEELAASEHLRALAEPLAAAGTKAGVLAHDMSSPLATVRCNLEWLWEAAHDGRIRAAEDEVMEVLDDARAATDKLREGVGELRQAASRARGGTHAN